MRGLALFAAIVALASQPAFACTPGEAVEYDDPAAPEAFVVRALVKSFVRSVSDGRLCYQAAYEVLDTLKGSPKTALELNTCYRVSAEEAATARADADEVETDQFGFAAGAEVLVGFTSKPPVIGITGSSVSPDGLRFLVPSCWGPLHLRLDLLSHSERTSLLEDVRTQAEDDRK